MPKFYVIATANAQILYYLQKRLRVRPFQRRNIHSRGKKGKKWKLFRSDIYGIAEWHVKAMDVVLACVNSHGSM